MAKKKTDWTLLIIILFVISLGLQGQKSALVDTPFITHEYALNDVTNRYYTSNPLYWEASRLSSAQDATHIGADIVSPANVFQMTVSAEALPDVDDNGNTYIWFDTVCTQLVLVDTGRQQTCSGGSNYLIGYVQGDAPPVWRVVSSTYALAGFGGVSTAHFYNSVDVGVRHSVRNIKVVLYEAVECTDDTHCSVGRACDVTRFVCVDDPVLLGDSDGDGVIDWAEVNVAVTSWLSGSYSWEQINTVLQKWVVM